MTLPDGRKKKGTLSKNEIEQHKRSYQRLKADYIKRARLWKAANPDKRRLSNRKNQIKRKYGITWEEYETQYNKQEGRCPICLTFLHLVPNKAKTDQAASVDHCHQTLKVRGLLCRRCNVALGFLNDKESNLERALQYIRSHATT